VARNAKAARRSERGRRAARRPGPRAAAPSPVPSGSPVLFLLRSSDWEARQEATALALTAAALGDRVQVALFGAALRAWVEERFDEGAPPGAERVGSLARMLAEGRSDLGVELVACETAIRAAGLDPDRCRPKLDAVRGLPEIWHRAGGGRVIAF